jgi:hypothetical protein
LINALPGNSSVKSPAHTHEVNNTVEMFSMWPTPRKSRVYC